MSVSFSVTYWGLISDPAIGSSVLQRCPRNHCAGVVPMSSVGVLVVAVKQHKVLGLTRHLAFLEQTFNRFEGVLNLPVGLRVVG